MKKQIMTCWECGEGLKFAYDLMAIEGDSITLYFCQNEKCRRCGLAAVNYKTREQPLQDKETQ